MTDRPRAAWMRRALEVSDAARGVSTPNPPVGAVILDADGAEVAVGATEAAGGRHAEVVALDTAGERARGGTAVVTLEPCDHTGRTGPCTARLLDAGIARVVYGVPDPDPIAAGGAATLARAGVEVLAHDDPEEVRSGPLRAWLHRRATGRPLVTWKYAASLDGRVAAADGTSRWITGPESRAHAHRRRARADAIVVGSGTLRADDPALTAREPSGALSGHQPLACVMGLGEVPADAAVRRAPGGFRHLATRDPEQALAALGDVGDVVLEGGPTLAGAFLAAGLVDEVDAYLAPVVLGEGRPAVLGAGVDTLVGAHRFEVCHTETTGADVHVHLRRWREE